MATSAPDKDPRESLNNFKNKIAKEYDGMSIEQLNAEARRLSDTLMNHPKSNEAHKKAGREGMNFVASQTPVKKGPDTLFGSGALSAEQYKAKNSDHPDVRMN